MLTSCPRFSPSAAIRIGDRRVSRTGRKSRPPFQAVPSYFKIGTPPRTRVTCAINSRSRKPTSKLLFFSARGGQDLKALFFFFSCKEARPSLFGRPRAGPTRSSRCGSLFFFPSFLSPGQTGQHFLLSDRYFGRHVIFFNFPPFFPPAGGRVPWVSAPF